MLSSMPKLRTVAAGLAGVAFLSLPLLAVVDVPGEQRVKELVGINVDGCGPILNRGDERDWRREPDTPVLRDGPSSAAIGDRIYLVGGIRGWSEDYAIAHSLDTVEAFDVRTRRWERLPPLPRRLNHVNVAAVGGDLYALGGTSESFERDVATGESWRYRVAERRWEPLPPMPTPRGAAGTAVVGDRIFVVGGRARRAVLPVVESFDTRTGRWEEHASMPTRRDHLAVTAHDGFVYALGGRKEDEVGLKTFERYDVARDTWEPLPEAPEPKAGFVLVDTPAGLVTAGGEDISEWTLYGGVFAYEPGSRRWRALPSMAEPKHGFGSEYVDGRLYVFGGSRCSGFYPVRSSASMAIG
jgi:hypothetical protein